MRKRPREDGVSAVQQIVVNNDVWCTDAMWPDGSRVDPVTGDPYINAADPDFEMLVMCITLSNPARFAEGHGPIIGRAVVGAESPVDTELLHWCEEVAHLSLIHI